ncbi:glycoside hydrolase family 2 protein [Xylariaceae sp. FL0594]|nr:glycoside hydrolase family 2 protein [Xylariaceae sp. FL0594]
MNHIRWPLDSKWEFTEFVNGSPGQMGWLPVKTVPTQVHLDLLANGQIPDPFLDLNELSVRAVAEKTWAYRVRFNDPWSDATELVFTGLDTYAIVFLNSVRILKCDNMFISHRVDVTRVLKDENTLLIIFLPALITGRRLLQEHADDHVFYVRQTEMGRVPVRKAQYNWGWDWGPILMTAGPWKPVYLESYTGYRIEDVWVEYELFDEWGFCKGRIFAQTTAPSGHRVELSLSLSGCPPDFEQNCETDSEGLAGMSFYIDEPKLWYPFTHGEQNRYELRAELRASVGFQDRKSKLIGFRQAELMQMEDDIGKTFYFRINGQDVFCGGSCWIPADSFVSRISSQRYQDWVQLLRDGNQNMVRVWGGGIYEDDAFYEACDALGIMVWQDFAFACASYPTYESYLDSVEAEARQNVRRLRSHPSLIIWAGNNEDYQVQERYKLEYNYQDKDPRSWLKSTFPARYTYEYLLPEIVSEEDPHALYHPGSPWGDGRCTADPTVGDKHQWDIWHGAMHRYQEAYKLSGRFISEFGMQAYPHVETTRRMITVKEQRYPGSMMMDFRNKAIDHERRLATYVSENFTIKYDLESYTHLTQIVQAEAMRFAYKTWRRDWGTRKCGGVLAWQLNDCWPTMSWAVVDYYLVKKPAYYAIKNALRPIDIGISRDYHEWTSGHVDPTMSWRDRKFDLWAVSNKKAQIDGDLTVRFISVRTGEDVRSPLELDSVAIQPNGTSNLLLDYEVFPEPLQSQDAAEVCDVTKLDPYVIHAVLSIDGQRVASDTYWPQPLKYLDFGGRGVTFAAVADNCIIITAARPTKGFVFQETEDVTLSDNGFDLIPGEETVVYVTGNNRAQLLCYTYIGAEAGSIPVCPDEEARVGFDQILETALSSLRELVEAVTVEEEVRFLKGGE